MSPGVILNHTDALSSRSFSPFSFLSFFSLSIHPLIFFLLSFSIASICRKKSLFLIFLTSNFFFPFFLLFFPAKERKKRKEMIWVSCDFAFFLLSRSSYFSILFHSNVCMLSTLVSSSFFIPTFSSLSFFLHPFHSLFPRRSISTLFKFNLLYSVLCLYNEYVKGGTKIPKEEKEGK